MGGIRNALPTRAAFEKITTVAERHARLTDEIAAASQEQAQGIQQVSATKNRIRSILVRSLKVPIGRVLPRTSTNLRSIALVVRV